MDLRKEPRLPLECFVTFSGYSLLGEGVVKNLSRSGWRVASARRVEPGTPLLLRVFLPDRVEPLEVELATVCWARDGDFGLNTIILSTENRERLDRFIDRRLMACEPTASGEYTTRHNGCHGESSLPGTTKQNSPLTYPHEGAHARCPGGDTFRDKRQLPRVPVEFPLRLIGDLVDQEALVVDLSPGGCRVRGVAGLEDSSYVRLVLCPPHTRVPVKVELAAIRWMRGQQAGLEFVLEAGLEFILCSAEQQKRLSHLIHMLGLTPHLRHS